MSEAVKNNNAQVKDNPKTNTANSNTIIERNSVASPMQAKDGAKAVVISAKEQQEPVKEVKVVSQKTEVKQGVLFTQLNQQQKTAKMHQNLYYNNCYGYYNPCQNYFLGGMKI